MNSKQLIKNFFMAEYETTDKTELEETYLWRADRREGREF